MLSLTDARAFAIDLAAQSADIANARAGRTTTKRKPDNSPVTEADHEIQRLLARAIADRYPEHAFIGEEATDDDTPRPAPERSEYCWVVDPLDGTRNFTHRFPTHGTSIALMHRGRPVVAVVYEHISGWHATAVTGQGVLCNDRPASAATQPVNRDTIIAIPTGRDKTILPLVKSWVERYVLRNVGSTALHMAYVATGAVDAAFCDACKLWDVAAGALLITESGAKIATLDNRPYLTQPPATLYANPQHDFPFFAATPAVFDHLFAEMHQ